MESKSFSIEPLLLCATPIFTYAGVALLTNATGFFFQRGSELFLVSSRHVFFDYKEGHFPDRIQVMFHIDSSNVARSIDYSIPLYSNGMSEWITGSDASGNIDVAAIRIDKKALPPDAIYTAFTPDSLLSDQETVEIGTSMLIVGFPLGFYDTLHKLPVVRYAINASSFAMRFQGNGYFLTDARTHRGSSGAPVVCRVSDSARKDMPWILLGVHSGRFDVSGRDTEIDEALGLNCAWFADILLKLTESCTEPERNA